MCVCARALRNIQREALALWTIWSLFFKLKACAFFLALFNLVTWKSPMQLMIIFSRNILTSCSNICRLKSERWVVSGGETQLQKYKVGSDCCWFSAHFEVSTFIFLCNFSVSLFKHWNLFQFGQCEDRCVSRETFRLFYWCFSADSGSVW